MDDPGTPEEPAAQDSSPSHGIRLLIGWAGGEPQVQYLAPGIELDLQVPEGARVTFIRVGQWMPPPPRKRKLEHGACVNCRTECTREAGTGTWYNTFGRDGCKALGLEGPHQVTVSSTSFG